MYKLSIEPQDKILVVAPHPDDESIGCGGLLLAFGEQTDVLLITDGRTAHTKEITDEECKILRRKEFEKAIALAGVKNFYSLNIPDGKANLCGNKELQFVDISLYTKIFVPNRAEEHFDHRAVNECIRRFMRRNHSRAELYEYEVWSSLTFPTHYLDISSNMQLKDRLVSCYESQLKIRDYHAMTQGLNAYRGVGCHTAYAEAYELISAKNKRKKQFFRLPIRVQTWIIERFYKH